MQYDTAIDERLRTAGNSVEIKAGFVKFQENVTENRLAITGFVDKVGWKMGGGY
jgi:hypothetical protein